MKLLVSEIFGPTFQGEGPAAGRTATFLRTGGCNLTCVWCDTAYTWDWTGVTGTSYDARTELEAMPVKAVVSRITRLPVTPLLVVTGGEPLIHQKQLVATIEALDDRFTDIHVETNGTIAPSTELTSTVDLFVVSPKLDNSEVNLDLRLRWDVLEQFVATGAVFKFVVKDMDDIAQVEFIQHRLDIPDTAMWIMPEGTDPSVVLATGIDIADVVAAHRWNLTLRMQQLLWPKVRNR